MGNEGPGVSEKTGGLFSTTVNVVNSMVGVGSLALPMAFGTLGWVAGPFTLLAFYLVSRLAAHLLFSVFEVDGKKNPRYYDAVGEILGPRAEKLAAFVQLAEVFLSCVAFIVSAALSMRSVANLICDLPPDTVSMSGDGCFNQNWVMALIAGGVLVLFVQIPGMGSAWVLSAIGATCVSGYMLIIVGLSIAKTVDEGASGSVSGISYSDADKAFNILQSVGNMAFAFSFSSVILEIQDTIREPPKAAATMARACNIGITAGAALYAVVAVLGYLGLGNGVNENVLVSFDAPKWLLILANLLVVIQLVSVYTLSAQVLFLTLEGGVARLLGLIHPAEAAGTADPDSLLEAAANAGEGSATPSCGSKPGQSQGQSQGQPQQLPAGKLGDGAGGSLPVQASAAGAVPVMGAICSVEPLPPAPGAAASEPPRFRVVCRRVRCYGGPFRTEAVAGPFRTDGRLCLPPPPPPEALMSFRSSVGAQDGAPGRRPRRPKSVRARFLAFSVVLRALFVALTTGLAILVPFFSQVTGVVGGLSFFPIAIYFPVRMYLKVYRPGRPATVGLYLVSVLTMLVSVGAAVGSFRNIVQNWRAFSID